MTQSILQRVLAEVERHDQEAADRAAARARLAVMLSEWRPLGQPLGIGFVLAAGLLALAVVMIVACGGQG